jgi:hypothetical protein
MGQYADKDRQAHTYRHSQGVNVWFSVAEGCAALALRGQHVTNTWYDLWGPSEARDTAREQTVLYGHLNWYSGTFRPHSPLSK